MNSYLCPFISVVVVDANGSPRCALEGIACTERVDACVFAANDLIEMSPGRRREDIQVVFADGHLQASVLLPENMDLPNASFFWDQYHLLSDIWPKRCGFAWKDNLSSMTKKMLYAVSESDHDSAVDEIHQMFRGQSTILNAVDNTAQNQLRCAKHSLDRTEGTLGKVSNNPAEHNHSSIVHWVGEKLYQEPGYEIKQLLGHQSILEGKRNGGKSTHYFQIEFEKSRSPELQKDSQLREAYARLDVKSYDIWRREKMEAEHYSVSVDEAGSRYFVRQSYESSPLTVPKGERCNCTTQLPFLIQCRHEIIKNEGMLCTDLIDPRYFFHGTVYNMVLRGGSINNKSSEADNTMLCQEIGESTNAIYVNLSTAIGDENLCISLLNRPMLTCPQPQETKHLCISLMNLKPWIH